MSPKEEKNFIITLKYLSFENLLNKGKGNQMRIPNFLWLIVDLTKVDSKVLTTAIFIDLIWLVWQRLSDSYRLKWMTGGKCVSPWTLLY